MALPGAELLTGARMPDNPWRSRLSRASFCGAFFYVDIESISAGRRVALHEYPKKDDPWAEDMGKHATRHTVVGYVIANIVNNFDHRQDRDDLENACNTNGGGMLIHQLMKPMSVVCTNYSMQDVNEKGGMTIFEMQFVERGNPGNTVVDINSTAQVVGAADNAEAAAAATMNSTAPAISASSVTSSLNPSFLPPSLGQFFAVGGLNFPPASGV